MTRILSTASHFFSATAVALFVVSILAVPTQIAWGEPGNCPWGCDPGEVCVTGVCVAQTPSCGGTQGGQGTCNNGCVGQGIGTCGSVNGACAALNNCGKCNCQDSNGAGSPCGCY